MSREKDYYIVTPDERRGRLRIGLFCLLYALLLAGIVCGALRWARAQGPKAAIVWRAPLGIATE